MRPDEVKKNILGSSTASFSIGTNEPGQGSEQRQLVRNFAYDLNLVRILRSYLQRGKSRPVPTILRGRSWQVNEEKG